MAETILKQTIIMLILILVGVLCAKTKIISKDTNKQLSTFVLQIVNPILILMSFQKEYRPELAKNLLITFGLSVAAFILMVLSSILLVRKSQKRDTSVERFVATYSNCAFMGIPLLNALYGSEGVFYLTAFITIFNFFIWTHGVIMLSGQKSMKEVIKVFYSPTIIAIAVGIVTFFLHIEIPDVPKTAMQFIADINTPLAMIVSGVTISQTNILKMLKKWSVYYICLLKLIVIPLAVTLLLSLFDISMEVRLTVIIAAAAPPAAMGTMLSLKYGRDSVYASEIFTAGTILSIGTLPLIVNIAEKIGCIFV